ncbi:MAG: type I DNA topoisomerase [Tenacibaculum sp.]
MTKNLVIVESPAKAKTIERYLGKDFQVASSFGHIADLPSKELGIDLNANFKPKYIVSTDKKPVVQNLKTLVKKVETVWLASDEDREGEAIAWHLFEQLKLKEKNTKRIVFHEITKKAIYKAVKNPRKINYNLVNAQQARRVLDRLVGYELSPVLWKKIKGGLSAGRVQSVAVRLIVEREREIKSFIPKVFYRVDAEFVNLKGKKFKAKLADNFSTKKEAEEFLQSCINASFKVADLQKKPAKKSPAAPFTTSTLQQEASRKLGFPVAKTMLVAQRLYEAGFITYMRTDSVNLSEDAKQAAKKEITSYYGAKYSKPRNYATKTKGAQEAHEAIRPTDMSCHEISANYDQNRLYSLIWKRTLASQMSDANMERTAVKITNNKNDKIFLANGSVITFEGFLKVYLEGTDAEEEEQSGILPEMKVNEITENNFITATERYTRSVARFTEASLVKRLEELGIGRPSTYAPTISTIQKREYIEKGTVEGKNRNYVQLLLKASKLSEKILAEKVGSDKGKLVPTDMGNIVSDFLVKNFSTVLDYGFTAKVEDEFDQIALGKENWSAMIKDFYHGFHLRVQDVIENADRASGQRLLGVDPETGKDVYVRLGRFGAMVQIGKTTDKEKPKFASLQSNQTINSITFQQAMDLFKLPKTIGSYQGEEVLVSNGPFGPYVKHEGKFISLEKGEDPMSVSLERAIQLIENKKKADAPIGSYQQKPIQKGVGRFGPYIKWNSMFINVSKKYDFNELSQSDLKELIEDKLKKEKEKLIHYFKEANIRVEKARWGRFNIIKGKLKIELPKTTDIEKLTQEEALKLIEAKKPKKRMSKKKAN